MSTAHDPSSGRGDAAVPGAGQHAGPATPSAGPTTSSADTATPPVDAAWDSTADADDAWASTSDDSGSAWSTSDQAERGSVDSSAWVVGVAESAAAPEPARARARDAKAGGAKTSGPEAGVGSVWDADAPPPPSSWGEAVPATTTDVVAASEAATLAAPRSTPRREAVGLDASPLGREVDPTVTRVVDPVQKLRVVDDLRERLDALHSSVTPKPARGAVRAAGPETLPVEDGPGRVEARSTAGADPDTASRWPLAPASAPDQAPAAPRWTRADPDDAYLDSGEDEAPARRPARGGARRGSARGSSWGSRRRAPAFEPPDSGSAAEDPEPDHEQVARSVALRLLTGAPRSRAQLAEAMARRDVPDEVADRVLDRFTDVGLVDDVAYAEILVRSRHEERKLSRRALAQELRRKGVDDAIAQEALEQVDDADEEEAARALARKKLRSTRGLDREVRLRRAYGALGRRGYGGSLVSRVVREELAAEAQEGSEGDG